MCEDIYRDGSYLGAYPEWHSEDSEWKARHLASLLATESLSQNANTSLKVAEIGCGYGGVLAGVCRILSTKGITAEATGYDITEIAIAEAAKRHPSIHFVLGDCAVDEKHFDIGLFVDVLEHVPDPEGMLRAARSRFKWLLIHLPLDEHFFGYMRRLGRSNWHQFLAKDRGHIHYYTISTGFHLLAKTGLKIVRWKYTPMAIELRSGGTLIGRLHRSMCRLGMWIAPDTCVRTLGGASLACLCLGEGNPAEDR